MKVTIDVDCTPAEARHFLGLPDLTPVHEAMIARMTEMVNHGLKPEDVQAMMQSWMPGPMAQGLQDLQKAFWDSALSAGKAPKKEG